MKMFGFDIIMQICQRDKSETKKSRKDSLWASHLLVRKLINGTFGELKVVALILNLGLQ